PVRRAAFPARRVVFPARRAVFPRPPGAVRGAFPPPLGGRAVRLAPTTRTLPASSEGALPSGSGTSRAGVPPAPGATPVPRSTTPHHRLAAGARTHFRSGGIPSTGVPGTRARDR